MASYSSHHIFFSLFLFSIIIASATAEEYVQSFDQAFYPYYGLDHFKHLDQDGHDEIQLILDQSSGAGFKSKMEFVSGRFHMSMKIPKEKSPGVLPNFYMISNRPASGPHSELDFEFMGSDRRTLQTNVFAGDRGGRERRFKLWFDPAEDFHSYTILWNNYQTVFFVDDIPITIFKNLSDIGARYPVEALHIEATIWDGSSWAGKINWTAAPFTTYYRDFSITGCSADDYSSGKCNSSAEYELNDQSKWELDSQQEKLYKDHQKYRFYDYCTDRKHSHFYPECKVALI